MMTRSTFVRFALGFVVILVAGLAGCDRHHHRYDGPRYIRERPRTRYIYRDSHPRPVKRYYHAPQRKYYERKDHGDRHRDTRRHDNRNNGRRHDGDSDHDRRPRRGVRY